MIHMAEVLPIMAALCQILLKSIYHLEPPLAGGGASLSPRLNGAGGASLLGGASRGASLGGSWRDPPHLGGGASLGGASRPTALQ